jgi:hypothetical protein
MEKQEIVEKCAEAAHEMNRLFCGAHGDFSQDNWVMRLLGKESRQFVK